MSSKRRRRACASQWFEDVFGFPESPSYHHTRSLFRMETRDNGDIILHSINDDTKRFHVGRFTIPSLAELHDMLSEKKKTTPPPSSSLTSSSSSSTNPPPHRQLRFSHIIGDARTLHLDPSNANAVFQAASQFNLLETPGPSISPSSSGITSYVFDRTQGPACALSCPAGTLYRHYFINGTGQGGHDGTSSTVIDCLADVSLVVGNVDRNNETTTTTTTTTTTEGWYWRMQNGYALPRHSRSLSNLRYCMEQRGSMIDARLAREALRVGVHWNTQVLTREDHVVAQVYAAAMPVGYDDTGTDVRDWEPLARLVLEGAYEATLAVGGVMSLEKEKGERVTVFLTMIGGGVFGNKREWIAAAIGRGLDKFREYPLDVFLVHYGRYERYYVDVLPEIGCN